MSANAQSRLLSGNEALAAAAARCGVKLGVGYPGTPSTEILENLSELRDQSTAPGGCTTQWSPNEKVALEVGLGAAYAGVRVIVTMKHVGLNVAADPLFTAAYTGVPGGLVIISADDPGLASSQNEQDSRHYARAAGVPMLEPSDSQEAYDYLDAALRLSEQFQIPVILRMTTRVCHSKTVVRMGELSAARSELVFHRDAKSYVMIPAHARPAHKRLIDKLHRIEKCADLCELTQPIAGEKSLGIITSGVAYQHAREAAPSVSFLKLALTWPLPMEAIRQFAASVDRCLVIEEGDAILQRDILAAGIAVEGAAESFHLGELNVSRVRQIIDRQAEREVPPSAGRPPQLCPGCPHRVAFEALRDLGCIVAGDIGCYTLGTLSPFNAMDTCVCMGASIGVGLGLRRALPSEQARKVVSVIGDSTFIHSGITGLTDMVYNGPAHIVIILDNGTTAMTGLQEHPGTGRALDHSPAGQVIIEDLCRGLGVPNVHVLDPMTQTAMFRQLLEQYIANPAPAVIIARRTCLLAMGKIKAYEKAPTEPCDVGAREP